MSQTAKAQEPSMEEILASIRRIIADDDSAKPAPRVPEPPPAPPKAVPPPVVAAPRPAPPPAAKAPPPPPPPPVNRQEDVDALLANAAPKQQPPKQPAPAPAPEVLDLTEAMTTAPFQTIDGGSDVIFAERSADTPEQPRPAGQLAAPSGPAVDKALISGATRAAVDTAFHSLANTVLGNNARTLEDLVKEMLRPMLRSWLDDNLPGLVERLVRAEIERVSRGR